VQRPVMIKPAGRVMMVFLARRVSSFDAPSVVVIIV